MTQSKDQLKQNQSKIEIKFVPCTCCERTLTSFIINTILSIAYELPIQITQKIKTNQAQKPLSEKRHMLRIVIDSFRKKMFLEDYWQICVKYCKGSINQISVRGDGNPSKFTKGLIILRNQSRLFSKKTFEGSKAVELKVFEGEQRVEAVGAINKDDKRKVNFDYSVVKEFKIDLPEKYNQYVDQIALEAQANKLSIEQRKSQIIIKKTQEIISLIRIPSHCTVRSFG